MKPTSKKALNNAKYCRKYRNKKVDKIRKKDKERKKFAREYMKYCETTKYEEQKRKDRERKRCAKERKEMEELILSEENHEGVPQELSEEVPSSSFKHKATKHRSLKKAEEALPNK